MTKKYRIPLERMPMVTSKELQDTKPEVTHYNGNEETPEVETDLHDNLENCKSRQSERMPRKKKEKMLVKCAKLIDKSSRFLFPFTFLIFNIGYWYYFSI